MVEEYTQEEYWKLFNNLPEELKDTIVSPHTAETIRDICDKNDIDEVRTVAEIVGEVLLGVLSPEDELVSELEEELETTSEKAKKVKKEIVMFILHPVKESLEALYEIKIKSPSLENRKNRAESKSGPSKDDYREPIE